MEERETTVGGKLSDKNRIGFYLPIGIIAIAFGMKGLFLDFFGIKMLDYSLIVLGSMSVSVTFAKLIEILSRLAESISSSRE